MLSNHEHMYECSCPRSSVYITFFIMSFQLATTMYEHYYQREPVNFFYYDHLSTHDHVCMLLAKCCSLYVFIMCFQLATIMYECITLVVRSLFIVLLASHDHVRMLLSKRSILYFYYVFPASHEHVWTFLSKMSGLFFFNYVLLSRYNHVWTLLSNWWSLNMFITWFQLATYECYCRFLLCVSS